MKSTRPARRPPALRDEEREVELGALRRESGDDVDLQSRDAPALRRHVLQRERHLEQRIAARGRATGASSSTSFSNGTSWCEYASSAMLRTRRRSSRERRVAGEIAAQHQRVDEEADHALELGPVAPGDGHAHRDVLLAAVAVKQDEEGGEQRHEQRRALAARKRLQLLRDRRVDVEGVPPAAVIGDRRPRPVERQLQHRHVGQRALPVLDFPRERLALHQLALPDRVVGVLHRQFGQWRGLSPDIGCVERRQLAPQNPTGPAVADDVVHGDDQPVFVRRKAQEPRAQQRPAFEVEQHRALGLGRRPCARFALGRGGAGDVLDRDRDPRLVGDHLLRLAVDRCEPRPQEVVAFDDGVERPLQDRDVERAADALGAHLVVERLAGQQPVDQPHPLLSERSDGRVRGGGAGFRGVHGGLLIGCCGRSSYTRAAAAQGRRPAPAGCLSIAGARSKRDRRSTARMHAKVTTGRDGAQAPDGGPAAFPAATAARVVRCGVGTGQKL